jgi:hypothetical protein
VGDDKGCTAIEVFRERERGLDKGQAKKGKAQYHTAAGQDSSEEKNQKILETPSVPNALNGVDSRAKERAQLSSSCVMQSVHR